MIKYYRGSKYPLQSLQERILMALAIKHVDDVVIGAPYIITDDLIRSLNISKVVHVVTDEDKVKTEHQEIDPYKVPRELKIYTELPKIDNDLTLEQIAQRVEANKAIYEKKFAKKSQSEEAYYKSKKSMTENGGSTH